MADATQRAVDLYQGGVIQVPGGVKIREQAKLRSAATDRLVWQAVFGSREDREAARWLIWELGQITGSRPASINDLYLARGRGECGGGSVPPRHARAKGPGTARGPLSGARGGAR